MWKLSKGDLSTSYDRYWDQVECTRKLLAPVLEAASQQAFLTVVMQGDHGGRVIKDEENPNYTDLHQTILAVRGPVWAPGLSEALDLLQSVLPSILALFVDES